MGFLGTWEEHELGFSWGCRYLKRPWEWCQKSLYFHIQLARAGDEEGKELR